MIWVINSNSNTCRIYEYDKKKSSLNLLKEIQHPENKLRRQDLTASKPGHYKSSSTTRGTYSPDSDPKEVEIDRFYREIANELDHGRTNNIYRELIIISPPHMNGLLHQHINKHVKERIVNNIQKDLLHLPDHELLTFLKNNAHYPNA